MGGAPAVVLVVLIGANALALLVAAPRRMRSAAAGLAIVAVVLGTGGWRLAAGPATRPACGSR